MEKFIGQVIEVRLVGEVKRPAGFRWRGREYSITRILARWHDYAMPPQLRRKKWTMRRHRNYYHVETDSGDRFELYLDRGAKRPEWVLLKHLGRVLPLDLDAETAGEQ